MIRDFTGMGRELGSAYHDSFAVRTLRADFLALPPGLQRETLERVQRIVTERPQSWLAKHWREIYRI